MLLRDGESAIELALVSAYPDAEPVWFSVPEAERGHIEGCVAVRLDEPAPHWVVVSRGFTELGPKLEDDPEVSGWGFELTCRLPARSEEPDLGWVVGWMESVARHLTEQVTVLEPYHHVAMRAPTDGDELVAAVFVEEPDLEPTRSANGGFGFFQMVGLTSGEHEALEAWDAEALVTLMRERDPLLLTDPARATYLRDAAFARAVAEGHARDGSSTGVLHRVPVLWFTGRDGLEVHLSVEAASLVRWAIGARLDHGKDMILYGERRRALRPDGSLAVSSQVNLALHPEKGRSEIVVGDDGGKLCLLRLSVNARAEVAAMPDAPGTYTFPSLRHVTIVVVAHEALQRPDYPG